MVNSFAGFVVYGLVFDRRGWVEAIRRLAVGCPELTIYIQDNKIAGFKMGADVIFESGRIQCSMDESEGEELAEWVALDEVSDDEDEWEEEDDDEDEDYDVDSDLEELEYQLIRKVDFYVFDMPFLMFASFEAMSHEE